MRTCCALLLIAALTLTRPAAAAEPPFECHARVGFDLNLTLPGYVLPTHSGARTCVPFTSVAAHPPKGYRGDYYVDEFTDAKLRQRWEACKRDASCFNCIDKELLARHPPNRELNLKDAHERFLLGKIAEKGPQTDLITIRRPGFFARAPYREAIAAADRDTYVVEFTAPADPYERIHLHRTGNVQIRGWYIRGLKDLVVVRGPHEFGEWPAQEQRRVTRRMIAYARAVLLGKKSVPGHRRWSDMKALVGTSGDVWEASTHPTVLH